MNGLSESRTVRTTTFCCGRSQSDKLREEKLRAWGPRRAVCATPPAKLASEAFGSPDPV